MYILRDIQQYMNIRHFEMLMEKLQEHRNEDGSTGFTMEKVNFN